MEENRSTLHTCGWVLIFFAVYDVFKLVINNISLLVNGSFTDLLGTADPAIQVILKAFFAILISCFAVGVLVQIFLGFKALRICKKPTTERFHIILAKIAAIVNILFAVIMLFAVFSGYNTWDDILSLIICACDVAIMLIYAKSAKLVRQQATGIEAVK